MPFCGPWGWGGFWIMPIVGLVVLLALLFLLFRSPLASFAGRADESPIAILKRRYARGEITREQFEQMRRDVE